MLANTPRIPSYSSRFNKRLSKKPEEMEMKDMRGSSPTIRSSKTSSNEIGRDSSVSPVRPTMFNSTTVGARNALANPRRSSMVRSDSMPRDRPVSIAKPPAEVVVLRKTNGPRQDEEGFDFHDMYPDDHNEAEKKDLKRASLSDMNEFQARGEERGADDDFNFRRIKKNWRANEAHNLQQAGKLDLHQMQNFRRQKVCYLRLV